MSNPYVELTKIIEQRGATLNGYDLEVAKVINLSPLTIKVGEVDVSVNLSVNTLMLIDVKVDEIITEETGLKEALKSILKAVLIEAGDFVIVQRVGNNFYILSKVVEI